MNFYIGYILFWCLCLFAAVGLLIKKAQFKDNLVQYVRFLSDPWKAATFVVATASITLVAPYSGDPTWDYFDGAAISILTFATAPWAVGAIFRSFQAKANRSNIFIALCLMFFSCSWFYDTYLFIRDGLYPTTWLPNLIISPTFYLAGGLFWNLEHHPERGMIFSFQRGSWYHEIFDTSFRKLIWVAIPLMGFAVYGVAWFVITK